MKKALDTRIEESSWQVDGQALSRRPSVPSASRPGSDCRCPATSPESEIAIIGAGAEPDNNAGCGPVYMAHLRDLPAPLLRVSPGPTQEGVDPHVPRAVRIPELADRLVGVRG